jgi:hypothetical protein
MGSFKITCVPEREASREFDAEIPYGIKRESLSVEQGELSQEQEDRFDETAKLFASGARPLPLT